MSEPLKGWFIVELMGHRRLAGYVTEQTIAGAGFLRVEIPGIGTEDGKVATQFYPPSSVYCLTPTTEPIARSVALNSWPEPVTAWELRPRPALETGGVKVSLGPDGQVDFEDEDPEREP